MKQYTGKYATIGFDGSLRIYEAEGELLFSGTLLDSNDFVEKLHQKTTQVEKIARRRNEIRCLSEKEDIMEHPNMKLISFSEVQKLPNGTKVYVELIGSEWILTEKKIWNIKQDDGLHYEVETEDNAISFPYDFDYDANNMSILCYVGEYGCNCCLGDEALYWTDDENNAFVDSRGDVLVTVKDKTIRFKVKHCPNCGKEF